MTAQFPSHTPFRDEEVAPLAAEGALFDTLTLTGWHRVTSDPYATSWALLAALHSGEPSAQPLRAGCRRYLLRSQQLDGSWGQTVQERFLMTPNAYVALSLDYERGTEDIPATELAELRRAVLAARTYQRKMETLIYPHLPGELMRCFRPLCVVAATAGRERLVEHLLPLLPPPELAELPASDQMCFQLVGLCDTLPRMWQAAQQEEVATLCARQLQNGSWWCVTDFTAMALLALTAHAETEQVRERGWEYLRAAQNEDGGLPQFFDCEVFLTAYVCYVYAALVASHHMPVPEPLLALTPWLRARQQPSGLWSFTPAFPGGDLDDTAWLVLWLRETNGADLHDAAIARAVTAMLARQRADGSFPSWADLGGDPDVTAHVLHALWALDIRSPAAERALSYLLARQREDGSWPATWHVSPVYGTAQALHALARGPYTDVSRHAVERGIAYLMRAVEGAADPRTFVAEEMSMACWGLAAIWRTTWLDAALQQQARAAVKRRLCAASPTTSPPALSLTAGAAHSIADALPSEPPPLWLAQFRYTSAPLRLATAAACSRALAVE